MKDENQNQAEKLSATELGERIQSNRKKKDRSQAEFSEKLGVSPTTVSNWENGNSYPNDANVEKIAELLEIDVHSLTHQETTETKQKKSTDTDAVTATVTKKRGQTRHGFRSFS